MTNALSKEKVKSELEEKIKTWKELAQYKGLQNMSIERCFINVHHNEHNFQLRRMHTIDTGDLLCHPTLHELPKRKLLNLNQVEANEYINQQDKSYNNDTFLMDNSGFAFKGIKESMLHENSINRINGINKLSENGKCTGSIFEIKPIIDNNKININETEISALKNGRTRHTSQTGRNFHIKSIGELSFGTQFHLIGTCNPCRYEWTTGCYLAELCRFCHDSSHAPEGAKRVIPDFQTLVTTRDKLQNSLLSNILASYRTNANGPANPNRPNNACKDKSSKAYQNKNKNKNVMNNNQNNPRINKKKFNKVATFENNKKLNNYTSTSTNYQNINIKNMAINYKNNQHIHVHNVQNENIIQLQSSNNNTCVDSHQQNMYNNIYSCNLLIPMRVPNYLQLVTIPNNPYNVNIINKHGYRQYNYFNMYNNPHFMQNANSYNEFNLVS
ncbi:conserved protein, unknown function [Hepatocystis sp. ex Piliocolobus tephrosceles]|nr:conserved protein, unknown function [Hepatocystis sp. ex Piliocolobus tephrosceles]